LSNASAYQKQIEEASYVVDATGDMQASFTLLAALEKASEV